MKTCMVVRQYYLSDPVAQRQAKAIVEAGGQVDVICLRAPGQSVRQIHNGVSIYRAPISRKRRGAARYLFEYFGFFTCAFFLVSFLFAWKRYDVIEVHTIPDFLVFSALLPKLFGRPIVLNTRDPMPELYMSKFKADSSHLMIRIICFQERLSWMFADHVLTVHDPMRDLLVERGLPPDKVSVVLNTPDERLFGRKERGHAPSGPKKGQPFTLLFTGTVGERHGLEIAIQGLAVLRHQIPDIRLVIVGEGDHLPCLRKLVQSLNLESLVEFRRPVPLEQVPDIVLAADLGISPIDQSSFSHLCLSTKVLEWLLMGLPVVASRTKTMAHYFERSIFFFEPGSVTGFAEQVRICYADPQLAREKVYSAQVILKKLGWHIQKQKYLAILSGLVEVSFTLIEE